jgi:hypothetical protein
MRKYLLMTPEAHAANELFRFAGRRVRYPWAWRKLQNARLHMLNTATREIEEDDVSRTDVLVTNGDIMPEGME